MHCEVDAGAIGHAERVALEARIDAAQAEIQTHLEGIEREQRILDFIQTYDDTAAPAAE
jgi:hypothetical protein